MAERLNFREACQHAGVSRQRLNQAIASGRLPAERGGGPGKPTYIRLEDLQAWCASEGLAMPLEAMERAERSERLSPALHKQLTEIIEQAVTQVVERLECSVTEAIERALTQVPVGQASAITHVRPADVKAEVLTRLRTLQAEGLSLQAIANRLNKDGVPTLSGKGTWQKGTIGNLLAQQRDEQT